jgi:hypothetical protein
MVKKILLTSFIIIIILVIPKITRADSNNCSLAGDWIFETVGEKAKHGMTIKDLTTNFTLKFLENKQEKKDVTGAPFGCEIVESKLTISGTKFKLKTIYYSPKERKKYIKFSGELCKDGKTITNGKYSMSLGKGTFTASKTKNEESVIVSCSFKTYGGEYYKNKGVNYVAIYVMDKEGANIVRTLKVIGKTWEMKYYREMFQGNKIPPAENAPDAITQATRHNMDDENVIWDLKDKSGKEVPRGTYRIYIELSEYDYTGALVFAEIDIDGISKTVTQVTEIDKPGSIHNVRVEYRIGAEEQDKNSEL